MTVTRQQVEELHRKAEGLRDYPGDYFPALKRARDAEEQWKAQNPEEAAGQDVQRKRHQADELRRKAADALHFDADGWLGPEQRQEQHDKLIAQAEAIEKGLPS